MRRNKEIDASTMEKSAFGKVIYNAAACILAVLALFAVMCFLVNEKNGICQMDLHLFERSKTMPVISSDTFTAETGGISITVEECTIVSEENMLYISILGENLSDKDWCADGSTFAVLVQCMSDPKPREYYYDLSEEWRVAAAPAGGSFFVRLGFHVDDAEKMFARGDKFSLVSFRAADHPTSVIVLNGLIGK